VLAQLQVRLTVIALTTCIFNAAAGLRIKETKEVYEGEVTELTPVETENPGGGYGKVSLLVSHQALMRAAVGHAVCSCADTPGQPLQGVWPLRGVCVPLAAVALGACKLQPSCPPASACCIALGRQSSCRALVLPVLRQVVSHVVIGLKTVKGTKQLKLDPTIHDSLQVRPALQMSPSVPVLVHLLLFRHALIRC
jgi:hypothetical protein